MRALVFVANLFLCYTNSYVTNVQATIAVYFIQYSRAKQPVFSSCPAQGCHIGALLARFRKSGEFSKRLATNNLVWQLGEFLAIFAIIWLQNFRFGELSGIDVCLKSAAVTRSVRYQSMGIYSYVGLLFLSLLIV